MLSTVTKLQDYVSATVAVVVQTVSTEHMPPCAG